MEKSKGNPPPAPAAKPNSDAGPSTANKTFATISLYPPSSYPPPDPTTRWGRFCIRWSAWVENAFFPHDKWRECLDPSYLTTNNNESTATLERQRGSLLRWDCLGAGVETFLEEMVEGGDQGAMRFMADLGKFCEEMDLELRKMGVVVPLGDATSAGKEAGPGKEGKEVGMEELSLELRKGLLKRMMAGLARLRVNWEKLGERYPAWKEARRDGESAPAYDEPPPSYDAAAMQKLRDLFATDDKKADV